MPFVIEYIIKLNICLAIVYLFYLVFLRRLTFYNWNRWYLLGYTALSFIIPVINIMPELQKKELDKNLWVRLIPPAGYLDPGADKNFLLAFTYWDGILAALCIGSLLLLIKLLISYYSFITLRKKAKLISKGQTSIYLIDENMSPFSFGQAIFINAALHKEQELEEIIGHEFVHVKQGHTVDIIWSEILCMLNWFNPFAWFLKSGIRQNLEFIADNHVLQNGVDKKGYQYLLLKVMGNTQFAFTNHFNISSLKKRIAMMNKLKSAKVQLIKFLFLLPMVAVLLLAFRKEGRRAEAPDLSLQVVSVKDSKQMGNLPGNLESSGQVNVNATVQMRATDTVKPTGSQVFIQIDKDSTKLPPLYILDGKVISKEDMKFLNPNIIESISVFKGPTATELYGEKGKNGVLEIRTKKEKGVENEKNKSAPQDSVAGKVTSINLQQVDPKKIVAYEEVPKKNAGKYENNTAIDPGSSKSRQVHISLTNSDKKPLLVLNGNIITREELNNMNPKEIESITILKDQAAIKLYGKDGNNGVILIKDKKTIRLEPSKSSNKNQLQLEVSPSSGKTN